MNSPRNHRCRNIVAQAVVVQQSRHTMSALDYLKSHDIAGAVIERVMPGFERRRRIQANAC